MEVYLKIMNGEHRSSEDQRVNRIENKIVLKT